MNFPITRQLDEMDCAPSCLKMIAQFFNKTLSLSQLRFLCDKGQQGVTLLGIKRAAEELGFKTLPLRLELTTFIEDAQLPCIVHWQDNHYVVVYKITKSFVYIADPARGKVKLGTNFFLLNW